MGDVAIIPLFLKREVGCKKNLKGYQRVVKGSLKGLNLCLTHLPSWVSHRNVGHPIMK